MANRSPAGALPVYQVMLKDLQDSLPTCVIAGPNRYRTWLYVHALTPMVLRLHPQVVDFLRDALTDLAEGRTLHRSLRKDPTMSYPDCLVVGQGDRAWLHVFAATPSAVKLHPRTVGFLQDALADLPATPARWP